MKTAVLLGASGMVGGSCLRALLDDPAYSSVVALVRRELAGASDPRLRQKVVDFDKLGAEDFAGATDVFCALGTTIRTAGTQDAFRRVDLEYPLAAAKLSKEVGARQFLLVSSVGADAASKNFYLRTKGELEVELRKLELPALHIFHPGLLLGKREERRPGERFAQKIAPALNLTLWGPLRRYRSIAAETVARAMVAAAKLEKRGTWVYEYEEMVRIAGQA